MKIKIKPKLYGPVIVHSKDDGALLYGSDGQTLADSMPGSVLPAELLLASVGACIAVSIRMVADRMDIPLVPFDTEVRAAKAETTPARIGRVEIIVDLTFLDDAELAMTIAARAKSMCTVSNSLNGDVTLSLAGLNAGTTRRLSHSSRSVPNR